MAERPITATCWKLPSFIHGQQFDLHAAVLQRRHQDQVLIAAAGDILHQILLVLLLQDRGKHAVGVGIHRQIVVALCGCITHHQLAGIARLQLGQAHRIHRVGKALRVLAHLPDVHRILLQDGNAHVGALGRWCKAPAASCLAVTVQILQQERRKQVALHGIFELCALPQPVVQGSLHIAVITRELGCTQKLFHLHLFARHAAACKAQAQQGAQQPPAKPFGMFQLPHLLLCVENPFQSNGKIMLLSVYHGAGAMPSESLYRFVRNPYLSALRLR